MDFQYKEITKKDGTKLVFCNLANLLKDFYGATTMDEVEPHATENGEYIIHCPFCKEEGHTKHKLYIKSDLSVGHCFVCGRAFLGVTDEVNVSLKEPNFMPSFWTEPFKLEKLQDTGVWGLDIYKYEASDFNQEGYDYLCTRQPYMKDIYKHLGFRFLGKDIVMPFYYKNELIYYQIRFSGVKHGDSGIRYFFPPISKKPVYILDHKTKENKLIICEGVFDAIALLIMAPDYVPCAILGSDPSDYEIDMIRNLRVWDKILIYMDETKISQRVFGRLKERMGYCPIDIIPSNGEDPEECLNRRFCHNESLQWIEDVYDKNRDRQNYYTY